MNKTHLSVMLVFAAAIGSGIVGGIFYAFSSFVMTALARVSPSEGITVMRSIDVSVMNASFMTVFMGTGLLCTITGIGSLFNWNTTAAKLVFLASLLYLIGSIGVTAAFNVPLNNRLASNSESVQIISFWQHYLKAWVLWNHIRTAASILSSALFTAALYLRGL